MINHSYIEGAYRFVDGSMQVSLALIEQIRAHGGTVRNLSEVTRIRCERHEGRSRDRQWLRTVGGALHHLERASATYLRLGRQEPLHQERVPVAHPLPRKYVRPSSPSIW